MPLALMRKRNEISNLYGDVSSIPTVSSGLVDPDVFDHAVNHIGY